MAKSSVMIDLDDPRIMDVAAVISNKTSKKILGVLAEKDLSEGDIAKELAMPLNTVGYNMKKLISAGLVEKKSDYFWSVKGKKIPVYRLSNKKIIISPKSSMKGLLPAAIISGVVALIIKQFSSSRVAEESAMAAGAAFTADAQSAKVTGVVEGGQGFYNLLANAPDSWAWFFIGAMAGLVIFMLWRYFRE